MVDMCIHTYIHNNKEGIKKEIRTDVWNPGIMMHLSIPIIEVQIKNYRLPRPKTLFWFPNSAVFQGKMTAQMVTGGKNHKQVWSLWQFIPMKIFIMK